MKKRTAQWAEAPSDRGVGRGRGVERPLEDYSAIVTREDRKAARRIFDEVGIRDTVHDPGLEALVRACRGRAWMGDPDDWAAALAGTVKLFVVECEQRGIMPDTYTLYRERKGWTRAWASGAGKDRRLTPVTLYQVPDTIEPQEMPRAYFDLGPEHDREDRHRRRR